MMFERLFRPKRTRIELDLTDAQIEQLRGVMDNLPLNRYAHLVVAVVKKLPLSVAVPSQHGAGVDPAPATPSQGSGGFSLIAFTPKGKAGIERVLNRLPHTGGDL